MNNAYLVYRRSNSFGDLEICLLVNSGGEVLNIYYNAVEGEWYTIDSLLNNFNLVTSVDLI